MIVGILMCGALGPTNVVSAYSFLLQVWRWDVSLTEIILHHRCTAMLKHSVGVMITAGIYLLNAQGDFTA